jgi:hypothetical protein
LKTHDALARLLAWNAGRPLPSTATLPLHRLPPRDRLLVAFLCLGGETSCWGVVWGHPGETPRFATTPDPRKPEAVATMLLPFAYDLLQHLPHPMLPAGARPDARRQLWLPGGAHVEVLHLLHYRLQHVTEPREHVDLLRALGRSAGWLFRESCRPGQQRVIDASAWLREVFAFPADSGHLAHLGFQLAWLATPGSRRDRVEAAAVAEEQPVGTALRPGLERDQIAPALDALAGEGASPEDRRRHARTIQRLLEAELSRRWTLLEQAVSLLDRDPRPATPTLGELDVHAAYQAGRFLDDERKRLLGDGEKPFEVHPETDGHIAAAHGYIDHQQSQDELEQMRLHGDPRYLEEAVREGDAVRGTLTQVQRTGAGRSHRTRWVLETGADTPLRLREHAKLCPAGVPKMEICLRSMRLAGDRRRLELEVTGGYEAGLASGFPVAHDASLLEGREVTLVPSPVGQMIFGKKKRLKDRGGPGSWLTVAEPVPPAARPRRVSEDLLAVVQALGGRG